jgi:hypothetical protein
VGDLQAGFSRRRTAHGQRDRNCKEPEPGTARLFSFVLYQKHNHGSSLFYA